MPTNRYRKVRDPYEYENAVMNNLSKKRPEKPPSAAQMKRQSKVNPRNIRPSYMDIQPEDMMGVRELFSGKPRDASYPATERKNYKKPGL